MTIYFLFQVCLIGIGNKIVQHMWNQFLFFISLLCAPCLPLSKLCVSYSSCCYFQYGPVCSQAQPLLPSLNYNQRLTHSVHSHVLMTFGTSPLLKIRSESISRKNYTQAVHRRKMGVMTSLTDVSADVEKANSIRCAA